MNKITVEDKVREKEGSFVARTIVCETFPKRWIPIFVQNSEKGVSTKLNKFGHKIYVSIQRKEHQVDRPKLIATIILSMGVYINLFLLENIFFMKQSFIPKLFKFIPYQQIRRLRFMLKNAGSNFSIVNSLKVVNSVCITQDLLKGFEENLIQSIKKQYLFVVGINFPGYVMMKIKVDNFQKMLIFDKLSVL